MITEDVHVKGFISPCFDTLKDIWVNQYVVNHLMASLIGSEISDAMSVQHCIYQSAFAVEFCKSSSCDSQDFIEIPGYYYPVTLTLTLLDKVNQVCSMVALELVGVRATLYYVE